MPDSLSGPQKEGKANLDRGVKSHQTGMWRNASRPRYGTALLSQTCSSWFITPVDQLLVIPPLTYHRGVWQAVAGYSHVIRSALLISVV